MSDIATDVTLDVVFFRRWMTGLAEAVAAGCDELTRLDAAIGDADHGINMRRGTKAVVEALAEPAAAPHPGAVLHLAGNRLVTVVGGAAGPIYGTAFRAMGEVLGDSPLVGLGQLTSALGAGLDGIQRLGAAEPGDKTIVDAWHPAVLALGAGGEGPLRTALGDAERAAHAGMLATVPMRARKGRASYLGWRSEGHQDPGATSTRLLFASLLTAAT